MQRVGPNWRTSSYTGTENCVEVADNTTTRVMVRDTKDRSRGLLAVEPKNWAAFVEFVKKRWDCKTFGVTPDHGRCIDDQ
ncbi:DUF397 domain-containing protein [Streptomyces sp. NPDC057253]|uniref:DUF397 domain-containing protein n=1 Tax=Streptomyces sp. NPDC057253 TaxID=3346069 RepID=UPI0036282509